eukprot:TRINITY_DN14871_c0_g1_i1.p1 TRINITY_DN14871_c0_g1~~TRINITY_DN14871_c0_g1_i1.p1  ORF type:complete len:175 (-),score=31.77 TRINITY_DN14871_c0_g1_i1:139-663(-)
MDGSSWDSVEDMDYTDPSNAHSFGWQLQNNQKELVVPSLREPPPTASECEWMQKSLQRVQRFYTEGEDKQGATMKELTREIKVYEDELYRNQEQQQSLKSFPPDHARVKSLGKELLAEERNLVLHLKARQSAQIKMQILNQKREELAQTMGFLNKLLTTHCTAIAPEASSTPQK